jgi:hypothetical protein
MEGNNVKEIQFDKLKAIDTLQKINKLKETHKWIGKESFEATKGVFWCFFWFFFGFFFSFWVFFGCFLAVFWVFLGVFLCFWGGGYRWHLGPLF